MVLLEVCVDSSPGVDRALAGGADRLEVCARLDLGGTTPPDGFLTECLARAHVPCFAMVRPRAGGFVYSPAEVETMCADLTRTRNLGADGFVLGALTVDGAIDRETIGRLVALARPLPVTFHRAFDALRDQGAALETLIELGIERVLTSGGASDAEAGRAWLGTLVARARGRITILAGGGIRAHNVAGIVAASGVSEVHSSTVFAPPGRVPPRSR